MAKKDIAKLTGKPVSFQIPTPAGRVQMETFIPWTLVKRGVRRKVIRPLDGPQGFRNEATKERAVRAAAADTALMRALGLAHHWQRLLDEQRANSVAEIAEAEDIDVTQVRRLLRLTLLAPPILERLAESGEVSLEHVMRRPWPRVWVEQKGLLPDTIQG